MLALLPLLIQLAGTFGPTLTGMMLGKQAGDVVKTAVDVAKKTFGTDNPQDIKAAIDGNPALAQVYLERIKAETEQYKASLADVADARATTSRLAEVGSVIAWGAPTISVIVVVGFISLIWTWLFYPPAADAAVLAVFNILIGTLAAAFGQVVAYWLGSSAGSQAKDKLLLQSSPK